MAWIAVDKDGDYYVYEAKPRRFDCEWASLKAELAAISGYASELLAGRVLTWEDEPVEVKAV